MNGLPYYKAFPRDFLEGTAGMPFELKGAYRLVLDLIYLQGGALPDDPHYIAGNLGMSVRMWNKLRGQLVSRGKLYLEDGIIRNSRADKEQIILRTYQDKQAENRRRPNKTNDLPSPPKHISEPDTDNTPQTPQRGGEEEPPDFERFWSLYPRRKGKGAARTKFAAALRKADAETIMAGVRRYVAEVAGKDERYIAHPATWLNQERWTDEPSRSDEDDRQAAWGIRDHEIGSGNFSRGGDHDPPSARNRANNVSELFAHPAEEARPVPERDVPAGRGGLALLALRT